MGTDIVEPEVSDLTGCEREQNFDINEAYTEKCKAEIFRLGEDESFVRDDTFDGVKMDKRIIYKLIVDEDRNTILHSRDGLRGYEFLVEFNMEEPFGIYYGSRAFLTGGSAQEQSLSFINEWKVLRGEIINVLNNTFPEMDFTGRLKITTLFTRSSFWPFWIAHNDDEDIVAVAARAVKLIRNIYLWYFSGMSGSFPLHPFIDKKIETKTCYTQEAYDSVLKYLGSDDKIRKFEWFLKSAVEEGILEMDSRYEKCWKVKDMKNVDFSYILVELCEFLQLPEANLWSIITGVFLSRKEAPFNNIRKSFHYSKKYTDEKDVYGNNRMKFAKEFCKKIFSDYK